MFTPRCFSKKTCSALILAMGAATATLFTVAAAEAQSDRDPESPWSYTSLEGKWFVEAGLEIELEPEYPGSDESEIEPFPLLQYTYRGAKGKQYVLGLGQIGVKIPLGDRDAKTVLVASAGLEEGRDAEESAVLEGLDPIDDGVDLALGLWHRLGPWIFAVQGQQDVGNDKGLVAFVGLGYEREFAELWRLRLSADFSWANAEHLRTELGITDEEAARTGYRAFQPGSGPKTFTVGGSLERKIGGRAFLAFEVEAERYLEDAASSPLIEDLGSETGIEAGLSLRWRFFGPR